MIQDIYLKLVEIFQRVKRPYTIVFLVSFLISFIFVVADTTPDWIWIVWLIIGAPMVLFTFITGIFHIIVGIQLRKQEEEFKNKIEW